MNTSITWCHRNTSHHMILHHCYRIYVYSSFYMAIGQHLSAPDHHWCCEKAAKIPHYTILHVQTHPLISTLRTCLLWPDCSVREQKNTVLNWLGYWSKTTSPINLINSANVGAMFGNDVMPKSHVCTCSTCVHVQCWWHDNMVIWLGSIN